MKKYNFKCFFLIFSVLFFIQTKVLSAQEAKAAPEKDSIAQPRTAQELYEILVGNTLIARTSQGNNSIEYHAANGKILGYNWDTKENKDSCWRVKSRDTVCYYYEHEQGNISETCWFYRWASATIIIGYVDDHEQVKIVARVEKGNPKKLSDFGKKWSCNQQSVASLSKEVN